MSVGNGRPVILITVRGLLKTATSLGRNVIKNNAVKRTVQQCSMKNALHLQWLSQWIQGKEEYVCPLPSSSHLGAISPRLSLRLALHTRFGSSAHLRARTRTPGKRRRRRRGRHSFQSVIEACSHSSGPVHVRFQSLSLNRHMNSCTLAQTITTVVPFLNQTADAGVFVFYPPPVG